RMTVNLYRGYVTLTEFTKLPATAGQAGARRMYRFPLALRIVVRNVQIGLKAIVIDIIREQIVVELELIDIDALKRRSTARPGTQAHRKLDETGTRRDDLCGTRNHFGGQD